uniref:SUN domain-containing protein n=1 Tax=Mesocestoides corti TaxID=53468 RepID=A0A5K3EGK9_MESCO
KSNPTRDRLRSQLTTLKRELEGYKTGEAKKLDALNAKIRGDIVSASAESRAETETLGKRLVADLEKISNRVGSIERLTDGLDAAVKKLSGDLASVRADESSQQSTSRYPVDQVIEELKKIFAEKISLDLKQKITEELTQTTDSSSDLKLKLINLIKDTVDERLKEVYLDATHSRTSDLSIHAFANIDSALDVFAADRTGKADFALESAGGTVVSTRCTRTYDSVKSAISFFGITLAHWSRSPNAMLQPNTHLGECWCFHGSQGQAIIRLAARVHVTGVSLEHVSKLVALSGRIDSAPREFVIKSLESEFAEDGEVLGSFVYDINAKPVQYFPIKPRPNGQPTRFIELAVNSNHGHPAYTCIYRLRVHGNMAEDDQN